MAHPMHNPGQSSSTWRPPVVPEDYDRRIELTAIESEALARLAIAGTKGVSYTTHTDLDRLLAPIYDLAARGRFRREMRSACQVLVQEMHRRSTSYWAWTADEWFETIAPTEGAFQERCGADDRTNQSGPRHGRQVLLTFAYLCCGFQEFERFPLRSFNFHATACHVFGTEAIEAAVARVVAVAEGWGYEPTVRLRLRTATAEALLANRSPSLDDLTYDVLATQHAMAKQRGGDRTRCYDRVLGLWLLSRILVHLKVLDRSLVSEHRHAPITKRLAMDNVPPEWAAWCIAWYDRSTLTSISKDGIFGKLIHVGRWLAAYHPDVTSPEQWDYDLSADFIAAVDRMHIGA